MKTTSNILTILFSILTISILQAQNETIAVINFDSKGILQSPVDIRKMVNMELQKLHQKEVLDEYDLTHKALKEAIDLNDCYGKECAAEVGKKLEVDQVITGSIIRFDEKITYNMRLISVSKKTTINSVVFEFSNQQSHMQKMTDIMLKKLFDLPVNQIKVNELAYLENPVISNASKLRASGPRMGVAFVTKGETSKYLEAKEKYPFMSQFGYQAEAQYMSTGNFQALFEFVGLVSGMDQGMFVPTISCLNGFRNTKTGFEFALGPVFGLKNDVEYDNNGRISFEEISGLNFNFVYAFGKTFKSGNLNIPVNIYISPNKKEGWYLGASMGFNLAKYDR